MASLDFGNSPLLLAGDLKGMQKVSLLKKTPLANRHVINASVKLSQPCFLIYLAESEIREIKINSSASDR